MVNAADRPFRFYDNRQKYLAFVTTCDEKWQIAKRASEELANIRPAPPSLRVFDAGVGDGTVLTHLMRSMHAASPTPLSMLWARRSASRTCDSPSKNFPTAWLNTPTRSSY